ncbi:hypothetical protein ACK34V_12765 [Aeromonas veronii]|uniref:hypothetical protein n=1 Tax=Aeromonas veronii TaxID=654 RepID=UPI002444B8F2|nr:hypothetical protein [Aeromonas veronii]
MNNFLQKLSAYSRGLNEVMNDPKFIDGIKQLHNEMSYLVNDLPDDIAEVTVELMERGWFIYFLDDDTDHFQEKRSALINQSEESQENYLTSYIRNYGGQIRQFLIEEFPNRAAQIDDAFKAHDAGLYYCSIPTLLALSEGIGRDLYGVGLYAKVKMQPVFNKVIEQMEGLEVFHEMVLKPLTVNSKVTEKINEPTDEDKRFLNRHLIIHGSSEKYGSELNSLKSISLVYYVACSLLHLREQNTARRFD